MIHPASSSESAETPLVYKLAASEMLPAFNPDRTIKHVLLTRRQARAFNRMIVMIGPLLMPLFTSGYLIRIATIFSPASVGRVLAPISPFLQFPVISMVMLAFRYEFVKILAWQFEFGFLVLTSTIWALCFAWYFQDMRVLIVPNCWLEFICLLLIESYFRHGANVAVLAVVSSCFVLALMAGVSASVIDQNHSLKLVAGATHSLATQDLLVNTMGTILTVIVRLAYRKSVIVRAHKRYPTSTFTQSIGYRCRARLEAQSAAPPQQDASETAVDSTPTFTPVLPVCPSIKGLTNNQQQPAPTAALLRMHFVESSETFDSRLTLVRRLSVTKALSRWQRVLLYMVGGAGIGLSAFAIHPASRKYPDALRLSAIAGLGATFVFVAPFVCSSQRQLLVKLHSSFDFLFLYAQHLAAHICLCDILSWQWMHCCAVLSSSIWTHWVLTLDTVTPVTKRRLGLRTEFAIPVLLAKMSMKVAFSCELLLWDEYHLRNRLLWDQVVLGHHIQFHIVPFVFSRMLTVFIWCGRIVYRIVTRQSPDELMVIQGNVEYDYVEWKRNHEALAGQSPKRSRHRANSAVFFEHGTGR